MIAECKPLFQLGRIVATPGALAALERAGQTGSEFLDRHVCGSWGVLGEDDEQANENALRYGDRILSAYRLSTGVKLWIITEADRSSTCLLLPEEY